MEYQDITIGDESKYTIVIHYEDSHSHGVITIIDTKWFTTPKIVRRFKKNLKKIDYVIYVYNYMDECKMSSSNIDCIVNYFTGKEN